MKNFDKNQKNLTFICGDSFLELDNFNDESIDCVITSPPYFREREIKLNELTTIDLQQFYIRFQDAKGLLK